MPDILLILLCFACAIGGFITFMAFICEPCKELALLFGLAIILGVGSAMWLSIAPVYSETITSPIYIDNGTAYVNTNTNPQNLNTLFGRNNIDPKLSHVEVIQHKGFSGGIYWVCQSAQWKLVTTIPDASIPSVTGPVEK